MKVLFEYPIPESQAFQLGVPKGGVVVGISRSQDVLRPSFSLAVLVDPEEKAGERISFFRVNFGEAFDPEGLAVVGELERGRFLWMRESREAWVW